MKSKKERLENISGEKYCFDYFEGTLMPNNPKFIHITMFDDVLFVQDEKSEESFNNINKIISVKNMIEENIGIIEKMMTSKKEAIKSSFNLRLYLKLNDKIYEVDGNVSSEELIADFRAKLFKLLDIK